MSTESSVILSDCTRNDSAWVGETAHEKSMHITNPNSAFLINHHRFERIIGISSSNYESVVFLQISRKRNW
jgi:hypothetical protein